jgi:anionic cell wall polymer biosynthesis LytR-Cps2A-Psr (LCP) family protein
VSIPRDLWVALPTDYNNQTFNKINAAYAIGLDNVVYPNKRPEFRGDGGAAGLLKYAAYTVTGIQVDNYIAVDFGGFQSAIDQLGGLEVDVPHTFDDYFYPVKGLENEICGKSVQEIADLHAKFTGFQLEKQFECRYEHIHYAQGKAKMTGGDALKFVRSRHSANYGGDFARSQRQFAVLAAIYDKVLANNLITNTGALAKLTALVNTDIKTTDVKSIFSSLGNTSDYQVEEVHLSTDNVLVSGTGPAGQYILIPKAGVGQWEEVKDFVSSN